MSTSLHTANTIEAIEQTTHQLMENAVNAFQNQIDKLHTGRASPALLENIHVEQPHGGNVLLSHMATITAVDAQTLMVTVWDKSLTQAAQKAILRSELGLNPMPQGDALRIPLPPLSDQRRQDIVRMINNTVEDMCEEIRNHRRSANNQCKALCKEKVISEDEDRRTQNKIQKLTDDHIKQIKNLAADKAKQILSR